MYVVAKNGPQAQKYKAQAQVTLAQFEVTQIKKAAA